MWVRSLGWEDPLEEGMAIHSSILARGIPMDTGAWQATDHRVAKSHTRLSNLACMHTGDIRVSNTYVKVSCILRKKLNNSMCHDNSQKRKYIQITKYT